MPPPAAMAPTPVKPYDRRLNLTVLAIGCIEAIDELLNSLINFFAVHRDVGRSVDSQTDLVATATADGNYGVVIPACKSI